MLATVGLCVFGGAKLVRGYLRNQFYLAILPIWNDSPVSSTAVRVNDTNDIVLQFDGRHLQLTSEGSLTKHKSGMIGNYVLTCPGGEYRIIFHGDLVSDLTRELAPNRRPFDVLRDSLMLDDQSPISTAPRWLVRAQFMPIGSDVRLQHFETPKKMGFISGSLSARPETLMYLFDASGTYSMGILPLNPTVETWDEMANRIRLTARTGNSDSLPITSESRYP